MLFKATVSHTIFLLKRKEALVVFYILLLMVLINFTGNVLAFQNYDLVKMYQPMKLLLLSYNRTNYNATNTLMLIQLYPLLVVCPAGFSLLREYQRGTQVFLAARLGYFRYQFSKLLAAFCTTMLIFTVPFLIELLLNCLAFPLSATGDLTNWAYYSTEYINSVNHYFMKELFLYSPYLYAVAGTLLFGIVSGILGAFTMAVSAIIRVRYTIFLFLPVFILLNLSVILPGGHSAEASSIKWYDYVLLFNDQPKNIGFLVVGLSILILFSTGAVSISGRGDCL